MDTRRQFRIPQCLRVILLCVCLGTYRSMISNGCSMIVMLRAQRFLTEQGWR